MSQTSRSGRLRESPAESGNRVPSAIELHLSSLLSTSTTLLNTGQFCCLDLVHDLVPIIGGHVFRPSRSSRYRCKPLSDTSCFPCSWRAQRLADSTRTTRWLEASDMGFVNSMWWRVGFRIRSIFIDALLSSSCQNGWSERITGWHLPFSSALSFSKTTLDLWITDVPRFRTHQDYPIPLQTTKKPCRLSEQDFFRLTASSVLGSSSPHVVERLDRR